jgi:hypothetical protein
MSFTATPNPVEPSDSLTASGTGSRKRPTRIRVAATDPTMPNAILAEFTMPANGRFTKAIYAPGGPARETSLVLQQKRADGVWAQTASVKLLLVASGGGGGTAPEPPNVPPASPFPVVSNVQGTVTGQTTATITANTDIASTVVVEYGTTIAYGSQTAATSSGTSHSRDLTGLTAGTTYHYRVRATASGNLTLDSDRTFTTQGTVVVPPPPDPPPGQTGTIVLPGFLVEAALDGETDMILVDTHGPYRESFGSTQRSLSFTMKAHYGQLPVIDGTGQLQNFYYNLNGVIVFRQLRWQGFRANGSGVIGNNNGTMTLDACTGVGLGPVNSLSQYVYAFGNGTTTLRGGTRITGAPGSALQLYTNGAGTPTVNVEAGCELTGQHRGVFAYDGTLNFTGGGSRVLATGTAIDLEKTSDCTVNGLASCTGGAVDGSVRVFNA